MKVKFEDKLYRKNGRNGTALKYLCFDIFKQYLKLHNNLSYEELQQLFNKWHCNNNYVVLSKDEWESKTQDLQSRYFNPIKYNSEEIYFTTQWGNNGGDCDNIKNIINFAQKQGYKIEIIEDEIISKKTIKLKQQQNINIKNIILYGAPGVGKTHNYQRLISMIEEGRSQSEIFKSISDNEEITQDSEAFKVIRNDKRVEFVTFHQSYSYEDFIEGFRPNEDGKIKLEDGIFKQLCVDAYVNKEKNFYIVIDEINRGNISKIFGELITLIEEDKRDAYEVTLPYSKEKFSVPSNLYIIATMNSTDKSIATVDIALRRRFTFLKMQPKLELVEQQEAKDMMEKLNIYISNTIGEDYKLGHSYFMKVRDADDLEFVKEYKIKPLLEEYFYADEDNHKKALEMLNIEKIED
nr:AAA family ATPase [uncultured Sulfurimonas sp.]